MTGVTSLDTLANGVVASHVATQDTGLSLVAAASRLGVSPRTLRRRIQRSEVVAELVQGGHGAEYRVWLGRTPDRPATVQASQRGEPALSRLATLLEATQRDLVAKAEAAAMWQGRAIALEQQVAQLQAQLALPAPAE